MTFLIIGESLVHIVQDKTGKQLAAYPSGSALNVATGLKKLGRSATLLTHIGKDEAGIKLREHCQKNQIKILSDASSTPSSLLYTRRTNTNELICEFKIAAQYPELPSSTEKKQLLIERTPLLVYVGTIGTYLEESASTVKEWMRFYHPYSTIFYDLHTHASATPDSAIARIRLEDYLPFIDVIKTSTEDVAALYEKIDVDDFAASLLAAGVALVVVTQQKKGFQLYTARQKITIPAPEVKVVDTMGANDALTAALIDGLARLTVLGREEINGISNLSKAALVSLGSYGATATGITVSHPHVHMPTRKEISARSEDYSVGAL